MKKLIGLLALFVVSAAMISGCGNAGMKKLNPNPGTMTLYTADGTVLKSYQTDGAPEMAEGGHLYCKEKGTGRFIIIYGTYTFEENLDSK